MHICICAQAYTCGYFCARACTSKCECVDVSVRDSVQSGTHKIHIHNMRGYTLILNNDLAYATHS